MRTFPKELAELRRMVESRGVALRRLPHQELVEAGALPIEQVDVQGRAATIETIVIQIPDGSLEVVVRGLMPGRWIRSIQSVALDGFYLRPDGTVEPLSDAEFYRFD